jgi:hypothetical protein
MDHILLGAIAGGFSGSVGYLVAGKFHGKEKGESIYPMYAAALFCTIVLVFKFVV